MKGLFNMIYPHKKVLKYQMKDTDELEENNEVFFNDEELKEISNLEDNKSNKRIKLKSSIKNILAPSACSSPRWLALRDALK